MKGGTQRELFDFPAAAPELRVVPAAAAPATAAAAVATVEPPARGRGDNRLVPGEQEVLWPICVSHLPEVDRVRLFGDVPRNTRLTVKQVCRRLNCDSNTVHRYIEAGDLIAIDIAPSTRKRPTYRVFRWSLVELIWKKLEGGWVTETRTQGGSKWTE